MSIESPATPSALARMPRMKSFGTRQSAHASGEALMTTEIREPASSIDM